MDTKENAPCSLGHLLNFWEKMLVRFNQWRSSGGTVPPNLVLAEQISDLVLVDRSPKPTIVVLLEFACPWGSQKNF